MPTYVVGTPGVDTVVYLTRTAGQPDQYRREDSTGQLLEVRTCTAAESEQITALANNDTIRQQILDALATNQADITQAGNIRTQALALENTTGNRTAAQLSGDVRSLAQGVRLLADQSAAQARQLNKIGRLLLNRLEGTD